MPLVLKGGAEYLLDAPAKINLSLHIPGRRKDGYHELYGLVAFADIGDQLDFQPFDDAPFPTENAPDVSLEVSGPFAGDLTGSSELTCENLVLKTARDYTARGGFIPSGTFILKKNLPVASGLGGGSSDAAAALRLLQQLSPSPLPDGALWEIARQLGADVPMCLTPLAQWVSGIGEIRQSVEHFEPLSAVLVNPGCLVSTKTVFGELSAPQLPDDFVAVDSLMPLARNPTAIINWLRDQRNDLQAQAIHIAPVIGETLEMIARDRKCLLSRMSGSGATCFGLYENTEHAACAAKRIREAKPQWWVQNTSLG